MKEPELMQITKCIIDRYNGGFMLVGVCGRAGAGKTTITNKIANQLKEKEIHSIVYSGDWRFKLDSARRKQLFHEKWNKGLDQYLLAINQFTWWDFDKIYEDLIKLSEGQPVIINRAYNRETGKKELKIEILKIEQGVVFYESNILGCVEILEKLNLIIFLDTPDRICFERLMKKDSDRRSVTELAARNLITTYSENLFYQILLDGFYKKIVVCDSNGNLSSSFEINEITQIPVPIKV